MPRHSTFQLFSDTNIKIVNDASASGEQPKGKVVTEKVVNVMGSSAGAGSSEFHLYVSARNREIFRMEEIEERRKKDEEEAEYIQKVERNKREAEERTLKNAEKRKRKKEKDKEKALAHKVAKKTESTEEKDSTKTSDEGN